jgi:DNA helicase-2/ATP-dependent DNA helicase PcrA
MIWLPVVQNLPVWKHDRVFVDETQDLNACQIKLVLGAVKEDGRVCAVGDPHQAIYRFRGADENAFGRVVECLDAKVMPLSVTYRCARSIVAVAQQIVPELEAAPGAIDGVVRDAWLDECRRDAAPGDFILSRTNAPLIGLCLGFLREGRKANIAGRDIGATLAAFVKKSGAANVEALRRYVDTWRDAECKRLAEKQRDTQAVDDKADCLLALSDGAASVPEVVARIEALFSDGDNGARITLSTTHKAKGLERDRVWMLAATYRRRPGVEEDNLYYVAATRAKRELVMVYERKV